MGKLCFESVVVRKRRRQRATSLFSRIQPGYSLATHPIPGSFEVGMNPGTAISSSAPVVNRGYPLGQILVTTRMQ